MLLADILHLYPYQRGSSTFSASCNCLAFGRHFENLAKKLSKILKKIENSKLILKTSSKRLATKRLKELFQNEGVMESVKFIDRAEKFKDHLDNYNLIDEYVIIQNKIRVGLL